MFIHLHLHSEFSMVDSTVRLKELAQATAKAGMPAVALTDESGMYGLVKFVRECEKYGIKPLAGADVELALGDSQCRITLLCQNTQGYQRLSHWLTRAYRERRAGRAPVLRMEWLRESTSGLVALCGRHGPFAAGLRQGHDEAMRLRAREWRVLFGDRLYLELTRVGHAGEQLDNEAALWLAIEEDLPIIASNDVRFIAPEDFEAHEARVAIREGQNLNDPKRPRLYRPEQYLKSPQDMQTLFADLPQAIENTVSLAQRLNLGLTLGKYFLPAFPTPLGESAEEFLRDEAHKGLHKRLAILQQRGLTVASTEVYQERLNIEIDVICRMQFPGYFLIVADFIRWAKSQNIPVGPGRGSGAGSLVAYALDITDLDPLRYELLFERFLNPERVSMPDFDIDFCMDRRDEVIDYVARRYGREQVGQIITFGTMAAKACLRDTGRVMGMGYNYVDRIAKMIPARPIDISLEDALGQSEKAQKEPARVSKELKEAFERDEDIRQLIELALKLEDLTRNAGKHAGGVVIAPSALPDFVPLYQESEGESPVTQFDKDDVEAIGLVKFDFLGLRTLTIIQWAVEAIRARRGLMVDVNALPEGDAKTYELLSKCLTTAVFQLESRGMKKLVGDLRPDCFEDIIALCALFRPGPLQSGMVEDFVKRKHGEQEVSYPHPLTEPILKPTYGVIVYQEQVMQLAQVLAGYTLGGADLLRRAMGKKKPEEMAKQREIFLAGCKQNSIDASQANGIFDLMEKFAEYGFNKSHSAAYALLAYQTGYLKAHYAAEFMAATLSSDMDKTEKVAEFATDLPLIGIKLLPPDVNASDYQFKAVTDDTIRYGLGAIKGLGQQACDAIVEERQRGGLFRSLDEFSLRIEAGKLNRRAYEVLVLSGALDALGANRASLFAALPDAMKAAEQQHRDRVAGQVDLFAAAPAQTRGGGAIRVIPEWPLLTRLKGERDTLDRYLSGHPVDAYRSYLKSIGAVSLLQAMGMGNRDARRGSEPVVWVAGEVRALRRRGDDGVFAKLDDGSETLECGFFREVLAQSGKLLSADSLLLIEGALSFDAYAQSFQLRARRAFDLVDGLNLCVRRLELELEPGFERTHWQSLKQALLQTQGNSVAVQLRLRRTQGSAMVDLPNLRLQGGIDLVERFSKLLGIGKASLALARMPELEMPRRERAA
jgi:DNA polymerase-3 subunit alpha